MADRTAIEWALRPVRLYADFGGRAPRAEYWWYTLAITVIGISVEFLDELFGGPVIGAYGPTSLLLTLGLLIPGLAVLVRRLHDIDRSGWWALLSAGSYAFMAAGFVSADPEWMFKPLESLGTPILVALVLGWVVTLVVLLVFTVTRGDETANRFGPDPYGPDQLEEIFA